MTRLTTLARVLAALTAFLAAGVIADRCARSLTSAGRSAHGAEQLAQWADRCRVKHTP